jgi:hypothetical protein
MVSHTPTAKSCQESTQLFSVRLWFVTQEDGHGVLQGRAQHVLSGETYHFEAWDALREFLDEQLVQHGSLPDAAARGVNVRPM